MERIYDLSFEVTPDGAIELEQGFTEVNRISLHACHVRTLLERAGHLLPADELSKKLAERLCSLFLKMADDHRHLSHILEEEFQSLDGFIECLPDAVFPHHLWDQREAREKAEEAERLRRSAMHQEQQAAADDEAPSGEPADFQLMPTEAKLSFALAAPISPSSTHQ